ncbi:MAG: RluA family pseudouridine synthase, partial [Firmicutes bacterium]|nr:RluA family pseudouridine synthase [Bacillota bacterium]
MRIYKRSFTHIVTEEEASNGLSIKKLMDIHFDFSSRLRTKIKQNDLVTVNGKHTPLWIPPAAGDEIVITLPPEKSTFEPQDIPLDIIYEDEDLMAINKQPHLVVHPTYGYMEGTVAHGLSYLMEQRGEAFKIRFINRLDMDTSGILLIAKN